MKNSWRLFLCVITAFLPFSSSVAAKARATKAKPATVEQTTGIPRILNLEEISKELRLDRFKDRRFNRKIKIAILDNGFHLYEKEIGKTLPADTKFHPGPKTKVDDVPNEEPHGTLMAVLVAQVIKKAGADVDYELHLFNTQGFTKFSAAVEEVTKNNFDLVLHSQVWEYGGNGDGKGWVNATVDRAINSGVIWINAAGDFGKHTYVGPIEPEGDWLKLYRKAEKKKTTDGIRVRCKAPKREQCTMRLVLSWNDFKDQIEIGTDKDLDVVVCPAKATDCDIGVRKADNVLKYAQGALKQKVTTSRSEEGVSLYSREIIETRLATGTYNVRIKDISKNFDHKSFVRITVSGPGIELVDMITTETLLPPAENAQVITIGASDHSFTSRSTVLKRPDVNLKSKLTLASGIKIKGMPSSAVVEPSTSGAAALAAGLTVLHLGIDTDKKREPLISTLRLIAKPLPALPGGNDPVPGTPTYLTVPPLVVLETPEPREEVVVITPRSGGSTAVAPKEETKPDTPAVAPKEEPRSETPAVTPKKETKTETPAVTPTPAPKKEAIVPPLPQAAPKREVIKKEPAKEPAKKAVKPEPVEPPVRKKTTTRPAVTAKPAPGGPVPRFQAAPRVAVSRGCLQPVTLPVIHAGVQMARRMDRYAQGVRWGNRYAIVVGVDVRRYYQIAPGNALWVTDQGIAILSPEYTRTHAMKIDDYRIFQTNEVSVCDR